MRCELSGDDGSEPPRCSREPSRTLSPATSDVIRSGRSPILSSPCNIHVAVDTLHPRRHSHVLISPHLRPYWVPLIRTASTHDSLPLSLPVLPSHPRFLRDHRYTEIRCYCARSFHRKCRCRRPGGTVDGGWYPIAPLLDSRDGRPFNPEYRRREQCRYCVGSMRRGAGLYHGSRFLGRVVGGWERAQRRVR